MSKSQLLAPWCKAIDKTKKMCKTPGWNVSLAETESILNPTLSIRRSHFANPLGGLINTVYGTDIKFNPVSVEAYEKDRKPELGDFMGTIIAGIYEGIGLGADDVSSDYEKAAGRPHASCLEMISTFRNGYI